jgi:hypothetical protein
MFHWSNLKSDHHASILEPTNLAQLPCSTNIRTFISQSAGDLEKKSEILIYSV